MCRWTMGLSSDKTSKFFCINICCFSTRFYFLVPQWHYHPSFIKIVDVSDLYTPQNQNVHRAVSSNDQYQGKVLQQMCCLDPRVVPIGPIVRGVIAFRILVTWRDATTQVVSQSVHWQAGYSISNIFQQQPSATCILNFKNFNIWSHDCHCCPNLLLCTKFHQNWFSHSAFRGP